MASYIRQRPPRWFLPVGLLATLWGVAGCFFFYRHLTLGAAAMGAPEPADFELYAELPGWYGAVYGAAVIAATAGGVALLARAASARLLFLLSLAALVVQFGTVFLGTGMLGLKGATTIVFPAFLIAIAGVEIWFSDYARRRGWVM
jgi:hypothetical protein